MPVSYQQQNQHLMWRAGFGPSVEQLPDLSKYSPKEIFKALQKADEQKLLLRTLK